MEKIFKTIVESPIGLLEVTSNQKYILALSFTETMIEESNFKPVILIETANQLKEYFSGTRKTFDLGIEPVGSEFQQKVWNELIKIPFGQTSTYLDIAVKTGSKNNTRAVGLANGKNPIPIIIPCHRIIGTNGKLTGYAGGLERKKWLLNHELTYSKRAGFLF